jgi:molybdate transport system substrate-binding protein
MRLRVAAALFLGIAAVISTACDTSAPTSGGASAPRGTITVFAASSLTAAFTSIGSDFQKSHPGTRVQFNFAGSSTLAAQIEQGAIGDVFASADQPNMQRAVDAGLTLESPLIFARNHLAIVVGKGNPKHISSLSDLAHPGLILVLCFPGVPCGRYAAQALQKASVTVKPASLETDVKAVLSKVASGEADAGIVYVTDLRAAGAGVEGVPIPPALNVVAEYPIAILKESPNSALANAFVGYLLGDGRRTLARYGFTSP